MEEGAFNALVNFFDSLEPRRENRHRKCSEECKQEEVVVTFWQHVRTRAERTDEHRERQDTHK